MNDPKRLWLHGYGVIHHSDATIERTTHLLSELSADGIKGDGVDPYTLLAASDRITNAAMWMVVNSSYAEKMYVDGRELQSEDFKLHPEGHTGGSLNMVPAYVGYMLANALTGLTRGWVMSQGHTVAAIDSVNVLCNNLLPEHEARYAYTDEGLTRFTDDFYSYKINEKGHQDSPRGSHVNHYTAGGVMEGGYLGFTSLQYAHMPLVGERLVAFLSDGAFDEQRGDDWVPLWWRSEDSGFITPIMIANGRRIDQRATMFQQGGIEWFMNYLKLQHFDPVLIDGRDPSAFAWAIIDAERKLTQRTNSGVPEKRYPVRIPYAVAVAPKGAGFYNEGTNAAHDLPIDVSPRIDAQAKDIFNTYAKRLFVPLVDLRTAISAFSNHEGSFRVKERDNPIANRKVTLSTVPEIPYHEILENRMDVEHWKHASPMSAIDEGFSSIVEANTHLRPRVGNPDELRSNRMVTTLEKLKFRVVDVEAGNEESVFGNVITALNEEAVAGAAYGNKGGINIIVTYEAFGMKMAGELRQEIIFAKHLKEVGRPAGWISIPLVVASHTWENGKNEQSHQDPSLAEVMIGETSDISRVVFPADYNSTLALTKYLYQTHGQLFTIVASKRPFPDILTREESEALIRDGGIRLPWAEHRAHEAEIALVAIGSYQLEEMLKTAKKLKEKDVAYSLSYIIEPSRFRLARNEGEKEHLAPDHIRETIVPKDAKSVLFAVHTRPEPLLGLLQPLWNGKKVRGIGYINEGGTLDAAGLLFVNQCSWAHILRDVAMLIERNADDFLSGDEREVLEGKKSPDGIITNPWG